MILIITHKQDYTADFVINQLNEQKISYFRLNCEDFSTYDFKIDNELNLTINGISDFTSVWFRRTKLADYTNYSIHQQEFLLNEFDSFLKNIFSILKTKKWLSEPKNVYVSENKLLQLKEAKLIGFKIPSTLITTTKSKIKQFYFDNKCKIIIKPFWNSKIQIDGKTKLLFTNLVSKSDIENIENIEITPVIFQEYIDKKKEFRVTIVNEEIFIASVDSQSCAKTKIDWRRDNLTFIKDNLPIDIQYKCFELVKTLGLKFGAIDLIQDKKDNFIFLEINPNGQWVWIETDTNLQISKSIINYLK